MLTLKVGLIISAVLALGGFVEWVALKTRLSRENNLLEYAAQVSVKERARIEAEERQRQKEAHEQASRVFGLDFMVNHGAAFGGVSATCPDGQSRKGSVPLDNIKMYGKQSSGKDYNYYIEDQGLVFCAGESPDQLILRAHDQPFEIREAGLGRDQGIMTDTAVIKKDIMYYVILESHHEISIKATEKC